MKDHFFPIEKCMLIFYEACRAGISVARGEAPGNDTRSPLPALPAMNSDAGRVACLREAAAAKAGVGCPYFYPGLHPGLQIGRPYRAAKRHGHRDVSSYLLNSNTRSERSSRQRRNHGRLKAVRVSGPEGPATRVLNNISKIILFKYRVQVRIRSRVRTCLIP